MTDPTMPEMPEPFMRHWINCPFEDVALYTEDQMRARDAMWSARLAAAEERARVAQEDAQRYRWHRARNPWMLLANAWGGSRAACAIGDDPDAATDLAMADAAISTQGQG